MEIPYERWLLSDMDPFLQRDDKDKRIFKHKVLTFSASNGIYKMINQGLKMVKKV